MPTIAVKNIQGAEVGTVELSADIFDAPQNEVVVREALNGYLANQRQGTHSTKTRGFVSGGGKKPWKQKGTGRARQGSIRAPQWRGGAIIFGPSPRDYREKVNRKKRQAAVRAVLSARREEGRLIVVESLDFSAAPKTRTVVAALEALGTEGRVLFVTKEPVASLVVSARNIPYADVQVCNSLNVYDLLVADWLVMTRDAVAAIEESLK